MDIGETYTVADLSLAEAGGLKVNWARVECQRLQRCEPKRRKNNLLPAKESQGASRYQGDCGVD